MYFKHLTMQQQKLQNLFFHTSRTNIWSHRSLVVVFSFVFFCWSSNRLKMETNDKTKLSMNGTLNARLKRPLCFKVATRMNWNSNRNVFFCQTSIENTEQQQQQRQYSKTQHLALSCEHKWMRWQKSEKSDMFFVRHFVCCFVYFAMVKLEIIMYALSPSLSLCQWHK